MSGVLSQLLSAVVRAIIVVVVVATPSLLLPGTSPEGAQITMLLALTLGVFVIFEYTASYPAMIEFRDAPPFNRVRILSLFLTLFCLSIMARSDGGSTMGLILNSVGLLVGRALDFPFSPLGVIFDQIPDGLGAITMLRVQMMVGLAVFIMLVSFFVFALLLRLHHWPNRGSAFNVWVNLPTFDPTTGGDIVFRLVRDGRVNVILGFVFPFVVPVIGAMATRHMDIALFLSPHALVWGVSLWMFMSLSVFMRGLAMIRIAEMIAARRARLVADVGADAPSQIA